MKVYGNKSFLNETRKKSKNALINAIKIRILHLKFTTWDVV